MPAGTLLALSGAAEGGGFVQYGYTRGSMRVHKHEAGGGMCTDCAGCGIVFRSGSGNGGWLALCARGR